MAVLLVVLAAELSRLPVEVPLRAAELEAVPQVRQVCRVF